MTFIILITDALNFYAAKYVFTFYYQSSTRSLFFIFVCAWWFLKKSNKVITYHAGNIIAHTQTIYISLVKIMSCKSTCAFDYHPIANLSRTHHSYQTRVRWGCFKASVTQSNTNQTTFDDPIYIKIHSDDSVWCLFKTLDRL